MSTRSRIGIAIGENPIMADTIYCHCDGDPHGVGKCLLEHWNDADKVRKMISNGDMSWIGNTIDECYFYGRDRGEKGCHSRKMEIKDAWLYSCEEYNYLFQNGAWYYRDVCSCEDVSDAKWELLTEECGETHCEDDEYLPLF